MTSRYKKKSNRFNYNSSRHIHNMYFNKLICNSNNNRNNRHTWWSRIYKQSYNNKNIHIIQIIIFHNKILKVILCNHLKNWNLRTASYPEKIHKSLFHNSHLQRGTAWEIYFNFRKNRLLLLEQCNLKNKSFLQLKEHNKKVLLAEKIVLVVEAEHQKNNLKQQVLFDY